MTNIIRHSEADTIDIRWYRKREKFYLVIIDNGTGFDWYPDIESWGSGLRNISSRVNALNADARAIKRKKSGTVFVIVIS
jgi:signal transduction histidine kinase